MQLWQEIGFSGTNLCLDKRYMAGFRPAFTMIELIFVIVVLGILSAVAIPRLAASQDDAVLVRGKSQIGAVRSGIAMQKSRRLLEGTPPFIPITLDKNTTPTVLFSGGDFGNILEYGLEIGTSDGEWTRVSQDENRSRYDFYLEGTSVRFTYNSGSGIFDCNRSTSATNADLCSDLTN